MEINDKTVAIYRQRVGGKDRWTITTTIGMGPMASGSGSEVHRFIAALAWAMDDALVQGKMSQTRAAVEGILSVAAPIMFKLAGYKQDTVTEYRAYVSGGAVPRREDLIAAADENGLAAERAKVEAA
jgi:hypothetical protein